MRPTYIYWLIDIRPETLRKYPNGRPFYCGKTVVGVEKRLGGHKYAACKPSRNPTASRIRRIGENYVKAVVMEIVPPDGDWETRECRWIEILRYMVPDATNILKGGQSGPVGIEVSKVSRWRMREAYKRSERYRKRLEYRWLHRDEELQKKRIERLRKKLRDYRKRQREEKKAKSTHNFSDSTFI